ncbi:hypothetical protein RND81_03G232600 [Saponaria officinalis]|uniref:Uncharacterized protein n=1 Tax=Saponaria officinalis TaxID=3572 RepID=A0AAW1MA83_SAPOF
MPKAIIIPLFYYYLLLFASSWIQICNANYVNMMEKNLFVGMFVFGTSVVDNGNNNNINGSLAKANYLPYGIDFVFGPTGRFSNGQNVVDIIGDLLLLPLIPPFAAGPSNILYGVNYGSGGSGILDDTGSIVNVVINLNQQIRNFEEVTLLQLKSSLGGNLKEILGHYLFLIAEGNNDFEFNYLLQPISARPSVQAFVANLTSTFETQLKRLYNLGARKFAILTVYPIGCTPFIKSMAKSQRCVQMVNKAAHYYNTQLINLLDQLKPNLPGFEFVVVNTYNIVRDIMKNPVIRGFRNVTSPCCELKEIMPGVGVSCKAGGTVCKDRSRYVFFDGQHNTEAVNAVIAAKAFASNRKSEAYPFNLQRLAQLQIMSHSQL